MKNFTKILFALAIAVGLFFIGRCGKSSPCDVTTETTSKTDTLWRDRVITIDPIPTPTQQGTTTVYVPTADPKQSGEIAKLKNDLFYFQKVVAEKERVIAALEAGIDAGVGEMVEGEDPISTNQLPPNSSLVFENQLINLYNFEERDSLTGIRLVGKIGVLGFLSEVPAPQFGLVYPESFTTTTNQSSVNATKNRGLGLSLAIRTDLEGSNNYQAGARLHYRRKGFLAGGGVWSAANNIKNPLAVEAFIGTEIGWRKN